MTSSVVPTSSHLVRDELDTVPTSSVVPVSIDGTGDEVTDDAAKAPSAPPEGDLDLTTYSPKRHFEIRLDTGSEIRRLVVRDRDASRSLYCAEDGDLVFVVDNLRHVGYLAERPPRAREPWPVVMTFALDPNPIYLEPRPEPEPGTITAETVTRFVQACLP